jgi:hypothetical protein
VWFFSLSPLLGNAYCLYIISAASTVKRSLAASMALTYSVALLDEAFLVPPFDR